MIEAAKTIGFVLAEAIFLYVVTGYLFQSIRPTVKEKVITCCS